jgi:ribosome-binding factor A
MSKRIARFNEQLKRELSELIRTEVRDPRVGVVTITGVDTAGDLGSAKVYVRVLGGGEELTSTLEGLTAAAPFLRTTLGRSLRVRRIPELRFREDRSYEHARRIEEVLGDVMSERPDTSDEAGPDEDAAGEFE